jgi:cysteinyl-tRNA synthetase
VRLHDTYTGELQELPEPPGPIGIYWCGPTVYRRIHVGNALAVSVIPLWLKRWLEHRGYETKVVVNITDINDKIYDAAPGHSAELAADATRWYFEDTDRLGLGRPDVEPSAAETVPDQIAMIEELIAGGFAYEVQGDVYYRVESFPEYGRLSRQRLDQIEEQEPNPLKENPRDFALWKANKPGEDTWWDSPWGRGRPGWHIECSAMSEKFLGTSFAIHGGGLDLKFPHHENEIAQSRALGHEFARLWMHNGMLSMRGSEMHKSLGNDVSLAEALDRWGRETLLLFFMTGHWRKPLDYSDETLLQAKAQADTFRNFFLEEQPGDEGGERILEDELAAVLDDDFNTPDALALFHAWRDREEWASLRWGLGLFGLASLAEVEQAPAELVALAERRRDARAGKDFAEADRLRDELAAAGWEVRDVAEDPGFRLVRRS